LAWILRSKKNLWRMAMRLSPRPCIVACAVIMTATMSIAAPPMSQEYNPGDDPIDYSDSQGFFECVFERQCTDWRMTSGSGYGCFYCTSSTSLTHCDSRKPLPTPLTLICVQNLLPGGCGIRALSGSILRGMCIATLTRRMSVATSSSARM